MNGNSCATPCAGAPHECSTGGHSHSRRERRQPLCISVWGLGCCSSAHVRSAFLCCVSGVCHLSICCAQHCPPAQSLGTCSSFWSTASRCAYLLCNIGIVHCLRFMVKKVSSSALHSCQAVIRSVPCCLEARLFICLGRLVVFGRRSHIREESPTGSTCTAGGMPTGVGLGGMPGPFGMPMPGDLASNLQVCASLTP